jgi:hypothetical protein
MMNKLFLKVNEVFPVRQIIVEYGGWRFDNWFFAIPPVKKLKEAPHKGKDDKGVPTKKGYHHKPDNTRNESYHTLIYSTGDSV